MYEQRAPASPEEPVQQLWLQDQPPHGFAPERSDAYVVVDDRSDNRIVLSCAPWPHLDAVGRLFFPDPSSEFIERFALSEERFQRILNEHRRRVEAEVEAEAVIERPLRIGDAFLVRGLTDDRPEEWEQIVDVTAQARTAAKIALYGAVAPRLSEERAEELGLTTVVPETPAPPTGPAGAAPAV